MKPIATTACSLCACLFVSCSTSDQPNSNMSATPAATATPAAAEAPASAKGHLINLKNQGNYTETMDGEDTGKVSPGAILLYFPSGNREILPSYYAVSPPGVGCGEMSYHKTGPTTAFVKRQEVDSFLEVSLEFETPTSGKANYKGGGGALEYSASNVPFSIEPIRRAVPKNKSTWNGNDD